MTVTFQKESFDDWLADAAFIIPAHWEEAGDASDNHFAIDHDGYVTLERIGALHIITGRNEKHELVAYWIGTILPNMHYKGFLTSYDDLYWVRKDYRGFTVYRLYKFLDEYYRSLKVKSVLHTSKPNKHRLGGILEKLGYHKSEEVYFKVLDYDAP